MYIAHHLFLLWLNPLDNRVDREVRAKALRRAGFFGRAIFAL